MWVKTFVRLLQRHFLKQHPMHKIFNHGTVKKSVLHKKHGISSHIKQILNPSKCNFRVRNECPLDNKCLASNIVYKAKVSNETNNECKNYLALPKHHSKKDSETTLEETLKIKSMRSALNFQSTFGLENLMV